MYIIKKKKDCIKEFFLTCVHLTCPPYFFFLIYLNQISKLKNDAFF